MSADVVPFSSPQLQGQGGTISQPANRRSIAKTVDNEITMCIERIEEYAKQLWRLIKRMDEEELWRELGHATYRDYLNSVRERTSRVPAALRGPIRKQLEAEGASNREIAAATGTTARTVINDRNAENNPPLPRSNPTAAAAATIEHASEASLEAAMRAGEQSAEVVDAEIVAEIEGLPDHWDRTLVRLEGVIGDIRDNAPADVRVDISKMLRREADRMDPRKPKNRSKGRVMSS